MHKPHELYQYMRRCHTLEMEVEQVDTYTHYAAPQLHTERGCSEIMTGLETVLQYVTNVDIQISNLHVNLTANWLQYNEYIKIKDVFSQSMANGHYDLAASLQNQVTEAESKFNDQVIPIRQAQSAVVSHIRDNISYIIHLQNMVLDEELVRWKHEQQLSGNGVPMQANLKTIQDLCELLVDLICKTSQQVNKLAEMISSKIVPDLPHPELIVMLEQMKIEVTTLLTTLVTSTFVIEKQPPQVLKTNTRFSARARLLVGSKLNLKPLPIVTVMIITEQQAQVLLESETQAGNGYQAVKCGNILNNTGAMEYQSTSRQLSVSFRDMQLNKIKRTEKKGMESVTDEKLMLLFQSKFNVGGGEVPVCALSLPIVVIVHGNQEPHAWATVTWNNAFSIRRAPFYVPDKVHWGYLAETLRIKFSSATDGDLSEDNLLFLAEKIFRTNPLPNATELNTTPVSWNQFCKETLPRSNFTFWEWFYNIVKVTKDHLKALWRNQLIHGFIQKQQAQNILSGCRRGTFLLRFSDTERGGVTIAFVSECNEVLSLKPFISRDLELRPLANRVLDLPQLLYLYPNVAKEDAFTKHAKPGNGTGKDGYVGTEMVLKVQTTTHSYPQHLDHSPLSVNSNFSCSVQSSTSSQAEWVQTNGPDLMDLLGFSDTLAMDGTTRLSI